MVGEETGKSTHNPFNHILLSITSTYVYSVRPHLSPLFPSNVRIPQQSSTITALPQAGRPLHSIPSAVTQPTHSMHSKAEQ